MANRRDFIKTSGLTAIPFLTNFKPSSSVDSTVEETGRINFYADGEFYDPEAYVKKLASVASKDSADFYNQGGAVTALEAEFAKITGKEKSIFLPSGTMANQLAIKLLSGTNTKVFVQETSHVYRDEADAAQSVHNLRLIPVSKGNATFTLDELKETIDYHNKGEVFKSGTGVVSIENPVRRNDGESFNFDEMKKISAFCKSNNIKLHLDGARLHIASAYNGIAVKEYASYFDTVYISLYKYLGAAGGAVLSGDASLIDQIPHLIKIHGGTMFQSWPYAAMALHHLKDVDVRMSDARKAGTQFIEQLNATKFFTVKSVKNGTNIFEMTVTGEISPKTFLEFLMAKNIFLSRPNQEGMFRLLINETILKRDVKTIVGIFSEGYQKARKA
jgi:threonine aldolase